MYNDIQPAPTCEAGKPHSDFGAPLPHVPTDRTVRQGMERLEKLVAEAEELNRRLRESFGAVVASKSVPAPDERRAIPSTASDLGQAIMRIADRLENEIVSMLGFADASDV